MVLFENIKLYKTYILCKRKQLYFFVEPKKEEKNRCDHSLKIRSKSTSEFCEQVTAENAPASAFLVFC